MFGNDTTNSNKDFSEKISNTKNYIDISLVNTSEVLDNFYQNKAVSIFQSVLSFIAEIIMYLIALGLISILFFYTKLEPFNFFSEILIQQDITDIIGKNKITRMDFTVKALIAFISFLFVVIGFLIRSKRTTNSNLYAVTKKVKIIDSNLKESQQELEGYFKTDEPIKEDTNSSFIKVEPKDIPL